MAATSTDTARVVADLVHGAIDAMTGIAAAGRADDYHVLTGGQIADAHHSASDVHLQRVLSAASRRSVVAVATELGELLVAEARAIEAGAGRSSASPKAAAGYTVGSDPHPSELIGYRVPDGDNA